MLSLGRRAEMGRCAVVADRPNTVRRCGTELVVVRLRATASRSSLSSEIRFKPSRCFALEEHAPWLDYGHACTEGYCLQLEVPIAPLDEQKRIADKLDAVLAQVDACRERLDRVPAILKRFRQAVLAAATSGKLTEEWREEQQRSEEWQTLRLADVGEIGRGKSKHRPRNDPRLYGGPYPFIQYW